MWRRLRSLARVLGSRRDFEQGMSEELRFHLEQHIEDLVRSGVPRAEAERRARLEWGGLNTVREECREARGLRLFDELARQLRYAGRLLLKTPGFTATALLTLAVCLGANLTIFATIDSILLRPLPFPEADRLVTVFNTYPKAGVERDGSSITNYYERRGHIPAFSSLALYLNADASVGEAGSTERESITRITPDFFSTLETAPAIGRTFTDAETSSQTDHVVILTDTYWRQHFNADPQILGRQLRVNAVPRTIVGVLPHDFRFLSSGARLYLPMPSRPEDRLPAERHSGGNTRHMIARLQSSATLAQAQTQIDAQNATLEADDPMAKMMADAGFRSLVLPLHADYVAAIRPALFLLQAGAITLLLIGAVNLVNLLLIRANGRLKEIAVRQALGASRLHVVSEVIVETTLLTVLGGCLGLAAGAGGIRLLTLLGVDRLPLGSEIVFDTRLAAVAILGSIVLGLALTVPIVFSSLRGQLGSAIQSETRGGTANRSAQRLRHGFIVAQIAFALVLLAGAGLLGLSLEKAMTVSPGFRPDHVLTSRVSVPWSKYESWSARLAFNQRLLADLARRPGVVSAGIVNNVPLSGNIGKSAAAIKGRVRQPGESPRGHYAYGVDGDYFAAMGVPLREGRFLTASDSRGDSRRTGRACVVDEDFAHYYWPHESALGHLLFLGSDEAADADAFTVVGVVGAAKQAGLTDEAAQGAVYYPYALRTDDNLFIVIRSSVPPESLAQTVQQAVRQIDPEVPVSDTRSMDTRIAGSLAGRRSPALLAGIFSAIALLLTAVGTYGVFSYSVAQRRHEIGVRMALGARPAQIRGHFLALALKLLAAGTLLGLLGAWLTGQALRTLLFQVPPVHPAIFAAAAAVIGVVSILACLIPSARAARISPTEALAD
jgi:predicted permease